MCVLCGIEAVHFYFEPASWVRPNGSEWETRTQYNRTDGVIVAYQNRLLGWPNIMFCIMDYSGFYSDVYESNNGGD